MDITSPFPHASLWERHSVEIGLRQLADVRLEVAAAGRRGAPLVILLHGFPDLWHGWHHQIAGLSDAGFRVLAPNTRGYGRSEKPKGVASYDIDRLAADVVALADSEGEASIHLAGHDWGGLVAWWVATRWPERVRRLVILNAPHPGVFFPYVLRHPGQMLMSWYVGFFQLPWIPEVVLAARDFAMLSRSLEVGGPPGTFDDNDQRALREGWSHRGALTAMINYYRAAVRRSPASLKRRVSVPTRILFGRRDPFEQPGLAAACLDLCDEASLLCLDNAGHWIQREQSELVTKEIVQFCST